VNETKNNLIITIIIAVVVGVGAFFGGIQYQKSQRTLRAEQFGGQQFANRAGQQGGRPVTGSIISSDDTSVIVKLADGSSKIVLLTGATVVNKQTTGSKADLKVGERVLATGKENSDGSITADTVSLNPMLRGIGGTPSAR